MLSLRDIVRSGHVVRWNSVKHGRPQYLAEHHYMVTMIARALARRVLSAEYYTAERQILLVDYCLNHDLPELIGGDLPSVSKRKLEAMLGDQAEVFKQFDYEIHPPLRTLDKKMHNTPLKEIAKLADWADAIVYIQQEGQGNYEAKITQQAVNALVSFLPETVLKDAGVQEKVDSFFKQPISHTHSIEMKLKQAYADKIVNAQATYPEFNWEEAGHVLEELLEGEDAQIKFEY
ncbi:YfbR-like 5'-deoxynucleotidase [Alkalimarinus sediminis]|uniref:HD domain-containing protein n=1 Tax=Alkalimarinus sediminis TaxID=1632866 RepID=A0A9E8HKN7_9ALTE|nr:YfbR-like 5'-deoxynucleotidase [Alkalimarinus sediminis]UZW75102.1 HD domain-containing protein [Alkalimarinus sediminis]